MYFSISKNLCGITITYFIPIQASVTPAVPVPVSPGLLKQLPSSKKQGGAHGSQRHSNRGHHSPEYQHAAGHYYQSQSYQQRHESVSSSRKSKRRTRPRSGSPFSNHHHRTAQDHHRPRPRPHSTPNTMYS